MHMNIEIGLEAEISMNMHMLIMWLWWRRRWLCWWNMIDLIDAAGYDEDDDGYVGGDGDVDDDADEGDDDG